LLLSSSLTSTMASSDSAVGPLFQVIAALGTKVGPLDRKVSSRA